MIVDLYQHQFDAKQRLKSGSILRGGVGSGKSRTSLAYYNDNEKPKPLYIITTARKRDTKDWIDELEVFKLPKKIKIVIDSWNNIKKYVDVNNSFFIFDEQRVVGYGTWTKSFIKIAKKNNWILLSATPGDVWMDYLPVFIANGFYKNKTEFIARHVIYNRYSKYPKIDRYVDQGRLMKFRRMITVNMGFKKHTIHHNKILLAPYDENKFFLIKEKRWNPFENKPIKDASEMFRLMRKLVNSDPRRVELVKQVILKNKRIIIFYNFNFELDLLREMSASIDRPMAEWNGHKHELIPNSESWIYLVQYTAGAEGWNCVSTNQTLFYSQNYSYKIMNQSAGRTDRLNTLYKDLYYYHIRSKSFIDVAIAKALNNKQNFHEKDF